MREGYKKTEVGIIPEDWEIKQLDDISDITRLAGAEYSDLWQTVPDGEIIALRGFNIGANKIHLNDVERISNELSNRLIRSKLFKGDVVFPCVGTIGRAAVINTDNKYHINQNIAKITPYKNIYSLYLSYFLISEIIQKQIYKYNTSSSQPNVLVGNLRKFNIIVPSLKEQKKIAEILSTVDSQIDDTEKLIEKSKELKKGLMQKLLTKGIGHSEFKKTEVGEIPVDWEVKKLGVVTKLIKDGTHNPPSRVDEGIPLLSAENIFNRKINYGINEKNISIDDYNNMHKNYTIDKGDILMTIVGTIGRVAVVKDDNKFTVQRSVAIIKSSEELNNEYLSYFLESDICKKDLNRRTNSTAQAGLYLGELGKIKIILPSLDEQEQIAEILSSIESQIEEYENKKQKLEEVKKGLMQQLLTGKIRL